MASLKVMGQEIQHKWLLQYSYGALVAMLKNLPEVKWRVTRRIWVGGTWCSPLPADLVCQLLMLCFDHSKDRSSRSRPDPKSLIRTTAHPVGSCKADRQCSCKKKCVGSSRRDMALRPSPYSNVIGSRDPRLCHIFAAAVERRSRVKEAPSSFLSNSVPGK